MPPQCGTVGIYTILNKENLVRLSSRPSVHSNSTPHCACNGGLHRYGRRSPLEAYRSLRYRGRMGWV